MRTLGKMLLLIAAGLALVACFGGGITLAFWGFVSEYADSYTYTIGFKHPGDQCGNNELSFDVVDGAPLACGYGGSRGQLPGFTEAQDGQVVQLAKDLGAGGISPAEEAEIQQLVDGMVAALPADRKPHHPWFWGWKVGVLGLMVAAPPTYVFFIRPRLNRINRPVRPYRGGAHR
jgi:hypothetical protein